MLLVGLGWAWLKTWLKSGSARLGYIKFGSHDPDPTGGNKEGRERSSPPARVAGEVAGDGLAVAQRSGKTMTARSRAPPGFARARRGAAMHREIDGGSGAGARFLGW